MSRPLVSEQGLSPGLRRGALLLSPHRGLEGIFFSRCRITCLSFKKHSLHSEHHFAAFENIFPLGSAPFSSAAAKQPFVKGASAG